MNLIPIEEYNLPGNFAAMFEVSNANVMFLNSTKYKIFNFKLTKAVQECEINKQVFTPHLFSNEIDLSELGIKLDVNKGPYATHVVYSLITESNIKGVEFSSDITAEILGTNVIIKDEISKTKKYLCLEVVRKGNELFEDFVIDVVIEIFEHEVEGNNCLDCGVELKIECNHEVLDYGICSACGEFLGEVIPVEIGGILTTLNERIYYFKITNMQNRLYGVTLSYGDVNCKFYNAELEDITEDIITDGEMFNYGEFFIIVVEANNFTEFELLVSEIE